MSVFKSLQFDDINTLDKGVYISGVGAYNAPERDVELISIPGRNGDFILDNKRFKNIEVTYKAGIKGVDQYEFRNKFQQFRTLMASKRGYKRLTDEYNPNEYRIASFVDAIEAEAVDRAAEFEIIFNCKPQRFLMSGEAAISVADGDRIFNPTPFDASPMIMVEGYGILTVNGHEIEIVNETLGLVNLLDSDATSSSGSKNYYFNQGLLNTGDAITAKGAELVFKVYDDANISGLSLSVADAAVNGSVQLQHNVSAGEWSVVFVLDPQSFANGTSQSVIGTVGISASYTSGGVAQTTYFSVRVVLSYNGADMVRIMAAVSATPGSVISARAITKRLFPVTGDSTVTTLGHPTYIDCDLGEVYLIDNGSFVSLNHLTDLGSYLPVLSPGENLIEYDSTITSVEIIPRWWVL